MNFEAVLSSAFFAYMNSKDNEVVFMEIEKWKYKIQNINDAQIVSKTRIMNLDLPKPKANSTNTCPEEPPDWPLEVTV